MVEKWKIFYDKMIHAIEGCYQISVPENEQAGHAYKIALQYWQQVKDEMKSYAFKDEEEEINFYKSIKPKFTGYIEYLMLVSYGLIFMPAEGMESQQIYWQYEVERLSRFQERNKSFVEYYESGSSQKDRRYFLHTDKDRVKLSKVYNLDGEFMSSHDHLVASLLAEERYHEFAKKKLQMSSKDT